MKTIIIKIQTPIGSKCILGIFLTYLQIILSYYCNYFFNRGTAEKFDDK